MKPLTPSTPHVIMMVGIPGAGKTTFAEHFAKTFSAPYLNPRSLAYEAGIGVDKAEKAVEVLLSEFLKNERSIVYEGPTETKVERAELIAIAKKAGYQTLIVWVQTEPLEAKRRAMRKQQPGTPLTADEFDNAFAYFQAPTEAEKPVVISGRHTYATQLKAVLKNLARTRPGIQVQPSRNIIIR
jgi:predicted kinase